MARAGAASGMTDRSSVVEAIAVAPESPTANSQIINRQGRDPTKARNDEPIVFCSALRRRSLSRVALSIYGSVPPACLGQALIAAPGNGGHFQAISNARI